MTTPPAIRRQTTSTRPPPPGAAVAIETSGRRGSVALLIGGAVVQTDTFAHGLQHAAGLVPMVDRLLGARGLSPSEIGEIYVSAGPGSFTGLRIGITLAKTWAYATGARVVAVPTVAALAENAPPDARHVIIVLDAKRGQIFTARFERDDGGAWKEREPAHLDTLAAMIEHSPRPVYLLGEGIPYHRDAIPPTGDVVVTDEAAWPARAEAVAALGMAMAQRGEYSEVASLTPVYVRLPEAVEKADAAGR